MTPHDAFLQAILDDPDEEGPRLVYADWLEEQGDPRGEFIRLQCALDQMPLDDQRRPDMQAREQTLLREHEAAWAEPLHPLTSGWRWRRGFIERITIDAGQFLTHAGTLLRLAPVRQVQFRNAARHIALLAASPHLDRLTGLDFSHNGLRDDGLAVLLRSPHLGPLQALHLSGNHLTAAGVKGLGESPCMRQLTTLDLSANAGGDKVQSLAHLENAERLRVLHLRALRLDDTDLRYLADSPLLERLKVLGLGHNGFGTAGVQALAGSPHAAGLTALDLSFTGVDAAALEALTTSRCLPALACLNLSHCRLGDGAVRVLASTPFLGELTAIDLSMNGITDASGRELAHYRFPRRLALLDLIFNRISDRQRQLIRQRFGERVCLFELRELQDRGGGPWAE